MTTSALLAVYPSECYATTNFLERDFWPGITREHAVTHRLACDRAIGAPDTELIYDPQAAYFLRRTIHTMRTETAG